MSSMHAKQRIIKDVKNEDDNIQITGHVKELKANNFVLNDRTGNINVDSSNCTVNLKNNDLINVIGVLAIKTSGERIFQAKIIQDMNKLNFDYYLKLYELKKELK